MRRRIESVFLAAVGILGLASSSRADFIWLDNWTSSVTTEGETAIARAYVTATHLNGDREFVSQQVDFQRSFQLTEPGQLLLGASLDGVLIIGTDTLSGSVAATVQATVSIAKPGGNLQIQFQDQIFSETSTENVHLRDSQMALFPAGIYTVTGSLLVTAGAISGASVAWSDFQTDGRGFRVSLIPEPSSVVLVGFGILSLLVCHGLAERRLPGRRH